MLFHFGDFKQKILKFEVSSMSLYVIYEYSDLTTLLSNVNILIKCLCGLAKIRFVLSQFVVSPPLPCAMRADINICDLWSSHAICIQGNL